MKFNTKLWKRSKKSWATTIPHVALLEMDENKDYEIEWEYSKELDKWAFSLKELIPKQKKGADNTNSRSKKPTAPAKDVDPDDEVVDR